MELILKNVSKKFGGNWVLKDVNLSFDNGDVVLLLGANATGKTTLLKIISTIYKPTTGSIIFNGVDVVKKPSYMRKYVTFIPELPTLVEEISVMDNLKFFSKLYGYKGDFEEIIEKFRLDNSKKPVSKLSKGMKQRLSLAVSLLKDPDVIAMDEPASGLDRETVQFILDLIKSFGESGKIVVVSSHDEEDLSKVATKVVVIDNGEVVYDGDMKEVERMRFVEIEFDGKREVVHVNDLENYKGYKIVRVYGLRESIRKMVEAKS